MSVDLWKPCYCPCLGILLENFILRKQRPGQHKHHMETAMSETHKCSHAEQCHKLSLFQPLTIHSEGSFFSLSLLPLQVTSQSWLVSRASKAWWEYSSHLMARVWWAVSKEPQCRAWWSPTQPCLLIRCVPAAGKPGHKLTLSRGNTTGCSLWWVVSRVMDAWPGHTSVDLDWDIEGEKCAGAIPNVWAFQC